MTIETIKGVVGVKLNMFELIRMFLEYDRTGDIIRDIEDLCEDLSKPSKPFNEILTELEENFDSDEWTDLVADIGCMLGDTLCVLKGKIPIIEDEMSEDDTKFPLVKLHVYRLTHDVDPECGFIVGNTILSINTNKKPHYLNKDDDDRENRLEAAKKTTISFMESKMDKDKMIERKEKIDKNFPELKEKILGYYTIQNDCDCCS